jgi:DNA primase
MAAILDLAAHEHALDGPGMTQALEARGFGPLLERMRSFLVMQGVWQTAENIAAMDAETGLVHALALHNKKVQLNKDLKAAEVALGDDPSEENFERLRDIQNQISTVDGTEALIEGFGSLSGRATRSF